MKFKRLIFSSAVLLLLGIWMSGFAAQVAPQAKNIAENITATTNSMDFKAVQQSLSAAVGPLDRSLINSLKSGATRLQIDKDVQENSTPDLLVPQFTRAVYELAAKSSIADVYQQFTEQEQLKTIDADGGISGTVLVDGSSFENEVLIIAFDAFGYYAGVAMLDYYDTEYEIANLPDGEYYVLTLSQTFVDEIYDNIQAPLRSLETWRSATTVTVSGSVVTGIDFDLQSGAMISGVIYQADGVTPLEWDGVDIIVTKANSPMQVSYQYIYTDGTGAFDELMVPFVGDVKIHASSYDTDGEAWYPDQLEWQNGQTISITSYDDVISGINFNLQNTGSETELTGSVSGAITASGALFPPLLSIVVAYDAENMSFAGLGLALLGSYVIEDLPVGSYYLYADDYLGELFDSDNYLGEFYNNAHLIADATPVQVLEEQETGNINFQLDAGGSISGKVTKAGGAALDSLLMIAVNANVLGDTDEPFPASLGLGIAFTDLSGNYTFKGLPTGEYIIRTISDFYINLDLNNLDLDSLDSIIPPGKHKGQVVDEYYNDVTGILEIADATRIPLTEPQSVTGINIELAAGSFISGSITDAVSGDPVSNALLVAVDSETGFPKYFVGNISSLLGMEDELDLSFIMPGIIDEDGSYSLGPLPQGSYKLFLLPGDVDGNLYLPEFYDSKSSFDAATVINLGASNATNVNFTLDVGAIVQGYVEIANGYPAGADEIQKFPVIVYDTANGDAIAYDFVQFNGGYRVDYLPVGNYKVAALPLNSDYAVTYLGGGTSYSDANSTTLSIDFGEVHTENIVLDAATGSISGNISNIGNTSSLSMVTVVAFDMGGHIAGFGTSDYNILTNEHADTESGDYTVSGLRNGSYYLRTFSYTTLLDLVNGLVGMVNGEDSGLDLDVLLSGDLDTGILDLELGMYADVWYPNVPVAIDMDLDQIMFKFLYYGISSMYDNAILPVYFPFPFYQSVPGGASAVTVSGGGNTGNINFLLDETDLITILTDVEEEDAAQVPTTFQVNQNYPNPFNPSTTISFRLPEYSHVSVEIYDTLGRSINTLADADFHPGMHNVSWNGNNSQGQQVAAGLYFARVKTPENQTTIKMLFVK